MPRTVILTFKVPSELAERLDDLVSQGIFGTRSEALRRALIMLLREYEGHETLRGGGKRTKKDKKDTERA